MRRVLQGLQVRRRRQEVTEGVEPYGQREDKRNSRPGRRGHHDPRRGREGRTSRSRRSATTPTCRPGRPAASASSRYEKSPKMLRACCTPIEEGMSVITHDPEIVAGAQDGHRAHPVHPPGRLPRSARATRICELQTPGRRVRHPRAALREAPPRPARSTTPPGSLILNPEKCIRCGRCVKVCQEMQNVWAIEFLGRGEKTRIAPAADVQARRRPLHQVRPVLGALPRRRHLRERPDRARSGTPC